MTANKAALHSRAELGLSPREFGKLLGLSGGAVSDWETGKVRPETSILRKVQEISRLVGALQPLFKPRRLEAWLHKTNKAFDGRTPIDMIAAGEFERLWQMVYEVRTGAHS